MWSLVGWGFIMFALCTGTDVVWSKWSKSVAAGKARAAALWARFIIYFSLFNFNALRHSYWLIIPMSEGCALGSWLSVKHDNGKLVPIAEWLRRHGRIGKWLAERLDLEPEKDKVAIPAEQVVPIVSAVLDEYRKPE